MSIRLQTRVWDSVPLKGTELLLLLAIADHANDEGICWPRVERLAKLVRRSVRQTQRLLRLLEAGEYILTTPGSGRGKVTVIRLNLSVLPVALSSDDEMTHALDFVIDRECDAPDLAIHRNGDAPDFAIQAEKGVTGVTLCAQKVDTHDTYSPTKGVTLVTLSALKGVTHDTFSPSKGDTHDTLSPDEKVTSTTQKVTPSAQKGDIAPHACVDPSKNHQLNHQGTRASLPDALFANEANNDGNPQPKSKSSSSGKAPSKPASKSAKRARSSMADAVSKVIGEIEEQRAEERAETPQQSFFRVVAWVLGWEVKALSKEQRGTVAQTIGYLTKSGYTENDVRRFWSEVWLSDWRWKRNREHPRPSQLRSEIFRLRAASTLAKEAAPQSSHHELTPEELELREKVREARIHGRYSPTSALRERLRLPDLQGHEVGLPDRRSEASGIREGVQVPMSGRD